jgi:hypothetical protein
MPVGQNLLVGKAELEMYFSVIRAMERKLALLHSFDSSPSTCISIVGKMDLSDLQQDSGRYLQEYIQSKDIETKKDGQIFVNN